MNNKFIIISGVLLVFLFNLMSGIQAVYLSNLLNKANVFSVLSICFLIVTIFFILVRDKKNTICLDRDTVKKIFFINLTTLGNWLGFFVALKYLEPAISSALANAISPIATLIITYGLITKCWPKMQQMISVIGIFISMIFMVIITYFGTSAIGKIPQSEMLIGILMSFLCGFSMALNTIAAKSLNNKGISAKSIMSCRFILLIVVSSYFSGLDNLVTIATLYAPQLLLVAFFGNIIPLYALQLAIQKLEPINISMLLVLAPLFYLVIQIFDKNLTISLNSWVSISLSIVFVSYGFLFNYKQSKKLS